MKPLLWMIGTASVTCAVAALVIPKGHYELLVGMVGPLLSAVVTWVAIAHTHRTAPERMMGVMVAGLVAKMIFFGAYVAVALLLLTLSPVPFVISFTTYFIAMYAIEAVFLMRLQNPGAQATPHP